MKNFMLGNNENNKINIYSIIFILIYTMLLLYLSYAINVSEDEMYTLNTTSYSIQGVIHQSYKFEGQPPAYFLILSLWRQINFGIFFSRSLSVFFIIGAAFYFTKLVRLVSGKEFLGWLTIIFLLNPFIIWAALEIRLYALLIFLSTAALYYFFQYYISNRNRYLYIFLLISLIGLYTQYFFGFLISSLGFTLLLYKGIKPFIKFCTYQILVFILFMPNLFFIYEQYAMHSSCVSIGSPIHRILLIFYAIKEITFADSQQLVSFWIVRIIKMVYILLLTNAFYLLYKNHRNAKETYFERLHVVLFSLLMIIIHYAIFMIISPVVFVPKYMAIVFPFIILIFSLGKFLTSYKNIIFYCTFPIYFISLLILFYMHPVKSYDYKSIAKYIKNIEYKNEPILIYRAALSLPFQQYYNGHNLIVPLPQKVRFDTTYLINIKNTKELEQSFNAIKTNPKSFILISDLTQQEYTLNMNREMIDDYISTNFKVTLDTLFLGWSKEGPLRIRRLDRTR